MKLKLKHPIIIEGEVVTECEIVDVGYNDYIKCYINTSKKTIEQFKSCVDIVINVERKNSAIHRIVIRKIMHHTDVLLQRYRPDWKKYVTIKQLNLNDIKINRRIRFQAEHLLVHIVDDKLFMQCICDDKIYEYKVTKIRVQ